MSGYAECPDCQKMRDDWLNAMIALDVKRVAQITGQAISHMAGKKNDPEFLGTDSELRPKKRKVLARRVQKGGGTSVR